MKLLLAILLLAALCIGMPMLAGKFFKYHEHKHKQPPADHWWE